MLFIVIFVSSCNLNYFETENNPLTYGKTYLDIKFSTDKSIYTPGENVIFKLKEIPKGARVRYMHLGNIIDDVEISTNTWIWSPPTDDFKGYMAIVYTEENNIETVIHTLAIDVSSDWSKFPRYGFLSDYQKIDKVFIDRNIEILNRFHINGIQFYDWLYDHQRPYPGTIDNPSESWPDIFYRTNYFNTIKSYIEAAKQRNMKTMFYNLCYGATNNAAADGVNEEWYIFNDKNHSIKDYHDLSGGRSNIWLLDPGNTKWQDYIINKNNEIYETLGFDGYHIDQLGSRGTRYDYNGNKVDIPQTYQSFVTAMKNASPSKSLLFNAVDGYGQENIAKSPVDFLYVEVWGAREGDRPEMNFNDIIMMMRNNVLLSNEEKSIVLAAYMNYNISSVGFVNTPSILLVNASIFAWGGAHLELGEHYLINEYFPSNNLQMHAELGNKLINYYDFLVAYENILRDGGNFQGANVRFVNSEVACVQWPATKGKVATIGKRVNEKDVIHLINFSDAKHMIWRDPKGTQAEPKLIESPIIEIEVSGNPSKVWFASPDVLGGYAQELQFSKEVGKITLKIPSLKYWDMIVIEY